MPRIAALLLAVAAVCALLALYFASNPDYARDEVPLHIFRALLASFVGALAVVAAFVLLLVHWRRG